MNHGRLKSYSYLLEIGLALAALTAVNLIWRPGDPAFSSVEPHPYWLVVVPMAVYYGFKEGLTAAGACAGLFVGWTWYLSSEQHWLLFFNLSRLKTPILLLAGGLILGELRERHRRRERALQNRLREVETALQDLSVTHLSLMEANRELEVRILSQDQTVHTLYEAAESLKHLDEEAIYPSLARMLVNYLGVTGASVYLLQENRFVRAALEGDVADDQAPPSLPNDEGLMGAALIQRKPVTIKMILSQKEAAAFADQPILISAPLILEGGQVVGVLNVHKLPFLRFTPGTLRMVGLVADWASIALTNARKHKEVADKNIADELTGAYTKEYLDKRLKEEYSRARRYGTDLSAIMVKIEDFEAIDETVKPDILSVLGVVFAKSVRDSDMIFRYAGEDTFVLLLPVTPKDGAAVVAGRIEDELNAFQFRPFSDPDRLLKIRTGTVEATPEMSGPQEFLDRLVKDMEA